MAASMAYAAQLGIDTANPVTKQFEFLRCGIRKSSSLIVSPGLRGTRSRFSHQVAPAPYAVGGPVVLEARPDMLDLILPWALGGTKAVNTIALGETLTDRYVTVDKVARVCTYAGCKVNRMTLRSGTNRTLEVELDVQGKTYTAGAAASFPSIKSSLSELQPYVFQQGVLTLDGTARAFSDFTLTIDNALVLDKYENSETRSELPEGDRIVTLSCSNPFTSAEVALDAIAVAGIAGSLVFTNGNYSLTITLTNLKAPSSDPEVPARPDEIRQTLDLQVFATSASGTITNEVIFVNDSTA